MSNNEAGSRLEVAERRMEGIDKNITELLKRGMLMRTELEAKINAMDVRIKVMGKNLNQHQPYQCNVRYFRKKY